MLQLSQATQDTGIHFFVPLALLEALTVVFAALKQHDTNQSHGKKHMRTSDLTQRRQGGLEVPDRVRGRWRENRRKGIDDWMIRALYIHGESLFLYRIPMATTRTWSVRRQRTKASAIKEPVGLFADKDLEE